MGLLQIPPADETPQDELFQIEEERITATGTWTRPTGVDWVEVTVVGGGGAGGAFSPVPASSSSGGGGGGAVIKRNVPVSGPVPVIIGAGGITGRPSFDPLGPIFAGNGGNTIWGGPVPVTAPGGGGGGNGDTPQLGHGQPGASGGGAAYRLDAIPNYSMAGASAGGGAGGPAIQDGLWNAAAPNSAANFFRYGGSGTHGGAGGSGGPIIPTPHPQTFGPQHNLSSAGGLGIDGFGGGGGVRDAGSGAVDGGGANWPTGFRVAEPNTGGGGFGGFSPSPTNLSGGSGVVIVRYVV